MRIAIVACDVVPDPTVSLLNTGTPLGAMAISGALKVAGFEAEIFAQSLYPPDNWEQCLLMEVENFKPDVVAFSAFTFSWPVCAKLATILEESLGVPVIFGGYHVSGVFRHALRGEFPDLWQDFADHPNWVAVLGEGYETVVELVSALGAGKDPLSIRGVAGFPKGSVFASSSRPRMSPDQWPKLDRDRFSAFPTDGTGPSLHHAYTVSGVGCRFKCGHCATPFIFPGKMAKSPLTIVSEWRAILANAPRTFWDVFEDFTGDLDWVEAICQEIARQGIAGDLDWSSFGNVRDFTSDPQRGQQMLDLMSRSGYTRRMLVGVESANPDTLRRLGRPNAFEDVVQFVSMAERSGIKVWGTVMVGYPWEDEAALRKSLETIIGLPLSYLSIGMIMPLPGTPFYSQSRLAGLLNEGIGFSDYIGSVPLIKSPVSNLELIRKEYLREFFSRRMASRPHEFGIITHQLVQNLAQQLEAQK